MIRSFIYDALILRLTSRWYAEVLRRVPEGAALLDVGIGTAGALLANGDLVRRKRLRVVGIDIDGDYVARARQRLEDSALSGLAEVRLESVYDHQGGPYDAVYFSGSFMLLPQPEQALRHCCALLNPGRTDLLHADHPETAGPLDGNPQAHAETGHEHRLRPRDL